MSARNPDDHLSQVLRDSLHLAVDAVEPGADGLDRIRAKIADRHAVPRRRSWMPRHWMPAATAAVAERFKPDLGRPGFLSWTRPAAAALTGLFVVTAASWAVAALPSAITHVTDSRDVHTSPSPHPSHSRHQSGTVPPYTSGAGGIGGGSSGGGHGTVPTASVSPSCSTSPTPTTTPTITPTYSQSSSPTVTPTDTDTSTPPADTPPVSSPSPASSSTSSPTPAASQSPEATGKNLLTPDAHAAVQLAPPPSDTPAPSPTAVGTTEPTEPPVPPVPPVPCRTPSP